MKIIPFLLLIPLLLISFEKATCQLTQTIRGIVVDQILQSPILSASVSLVNTNKGTITAENGSFRIEGIPIGIQSIKVSCIGYKELVIENILVNAGKETVLNIPLEPIAFLEKEVVIKTESKRNKPLNDFSQVSARAFTVEETQKFAASVNDPLRMATNFPGVAAVNSGNDNDITIRGNSPAGLLWRMEGVDIPNPNHFATQGSSGGGISILSAQLLANSDFITGAFPADYGNALSGVFDLKLRKGNNERPEFTLQAGVLGLSAAMEGPLRLLDKSSYLVNYRYSTLQLLNKIGFPLGDGNTNFQDLSFNVFMPTKKNGVFTLFGFGGLSSVNNVNRKDSSQQNDAGNTGMTGITHTISLNNKCIVKSVVSFSSNQTSSTQLFAGSINSSSYSYHEIYLTNKLTISSALNYKFNGRTTFKAGAYADFVHFKYQLLNVKTNSGSGSQDFINAGGNTQIIQAFAESQIKAARNVTIIAGIHYQELLLNNSSSIEPRGSVKWSINDKISLIFGYGNHSQVQAMGVYFGQAKDSAGAIITPNKNLGFTKARHFVLGYNWLLAQDLRLKTEIYYQQLYNVPVSASDTNTYSTLNQLGEGYITQQGTNKGKGRNYGIELSLEKYLSHNYYFLLSSSLYKSKYTASDNIERNTRFAGNYVNNLVAGKDFIYSRGSRRLGLNLKIVLAGGFRDTPIDTDKSRQSGYTVYFEKQAFSYQFPAFFRTDARISYQWNKRHHTSTLSLDIQNVTNRINVYDRYYDPLQDKIVSQSNNGLIPVLNYKIEF